MSKRVGSSTGDVRGVSRLAGALRVLGMCVALGVAAMVLWAARVYARGEQAVLSTGQPLMHYASARYQSVPQALQINGAAVSFRHGFTSDSVSTVLDRFHAECRSANPAFADQWAQLRKAAPLLGQAPAIFEGVLRAESGEAGALACFDSRTPPKDGPALHARLQEAARTGDLSRIGDVRYLRAERSRGETHYIAISSEGPLNVRQMFSKDKDAPGDDPEGAPRPANTRRALSVAALRRGEQLGVYVALKQTAPELFETYRKQLSARGFRFLERKDGRNSKQFFVATNDQHMVTVAVSRDAEGRGVATLVSRPE